MLSRYFALSLVGLAIAYTANCETIARIEVVSGDRQISVDTQTPAKPFVIRALDANNKPISGATLFIGPAADPGYAFLQDEFHFRGFNTVGLVQYGGFGSPNPIYFAVTDSNGLAQGQGSYVDFAPSSFMVAAGQVDVPRTTQAVFSVVSVKTLPAGTPAVVVEYFNTEFGHYFNTLLDNEISALDSGTFQGWKRSIGSFIGYASLSDAPPGALPVCRFFSATFTSHFYTADTEECEAVIEKWPEIWKLETKSAFYIGVPNKVTGKCESGYQPIYRLFNNTLSPNHRYATDAKLRDKMVGAGWIAEGYGQDAVALCTPA